MFAAFPAGSAECSCAEAGLAKTSDVPQVVYEALGCPDDPCCADMCVCEFLQLRGPELAACQYGKEDALDHEAVGWCYVDPAQGIGDPALVDSCPSDEQRLIRALPVRSSLLAVFTCSS